MEKIKLSERLNVETDSHEYFAIITENDLTTREFQITKKEYDICIKSMLKKMKSRRIKTIQPQLFNDEFDN